jgi:hypothetical protein
MRFDRGVTFPYSTSSRRPSIRGGVSVRMARTVICPDGSLRRIDGGVCAARGHAVRSKQAIAG